VSDEFPDPAEAKYPVVTISVCDYNCNVLIFGTKDLGEGGNEYLTAKFNDYMSKFEYFKKLGLPMPGIRYVKFDREKDMLKYFLTNIVAKVPVLAGSLSLSMIRSIHATYFNKRIAEDHKIEDLYNVVSEGRWTIDYQTELTSGMYIDVNGNETIIYSEIETSF
jgi:hypothetical protein